MQFRRWARRLRRGITFRYVLVTTTILLLSAIAYGSIQVYFLHKSELLRLHIQATDQANFLSAVVPESVFLQDFLNLETLMRQMSAAQNVVYAVVVDTDGRALTRYVNGADPYVAQDLKTEGNIDILPLIGLIRADPLVQEVRSPVVSGGLFLGEVWLGYTTASIRRQLALSSLNLLLGVIVASLLLSVTTAILFALQIRRPLQSVIELSQALAAGELDSRVTITRHDELGELGSAFNQMAERLQTTLDGWHTANQALQSSEERTRAIVTTAAEGIITIDEQGIIESFNPAAARIFGYAPAEIVGQNVNLLMPNPHHSRHDGYLSAYVTTGSKKIIENGLEIEGLRKNGAIFPISLSVSELSLGQQRLFTWIVSDITERVRAEQALRAERDFATQVMNAMSEGLTVIDAEGRFEYVNPAYARLIGRSPQALLGRAPAEFTHPTGQTALALARERRLTGATTTYESVLLHADGHAVPVLITGAPYLRDGGYAGSIAVITDITERKRADGVLRAMRTQNLLLAQAVDAATEGITITDPRQPDNPVVYANPAFAHITGYSLEEVVGRNCRFLQGPESGGPELERLRRAIANRQSAAVTMLNYRKDGKPFWNELKISPIFTEDGELLNFVGIQTDSSERRQTAHRLQAVLDTVGEGILSADATGTIVMINPEAERIFGYTAGELLGQSLTVLMPEGNWNPYQADMDRYLSSETPRALGKRLELEGLRKNRQIFPIETYISETRFADQHLFTASIRDITDRKEYDRMRDDFVSTVTHELRTPLTSVMGWTETLLAGKPGPLTDLQKRFLGIVYESSGRLNRLVEEILTVSRVQRGALQLNRQEFSPRESIAGVGKMLKTLAEPKGVEIDYQEEWPANVRLMGDADRIEQVLTNLINNAIKFSPNGGVVTVASQQEETGWQVTVRDQGIGIPAAELSHLFERFYRASNANEAQIHGTGLGLYICKAIIEGHGGQIGIDSVQNEGTTVWFTVPG